MATERLLVSDLDPAYEALVSAVARSCERLRAMPSSVLAFAIMDASYGGGVADARRDLLAWCDEVGLEVPERDLAPTVWVLHYDGFRYLGMPEDDHSCDVDAIVPPEAERHVAHVGQHIIVDYLRQRKEWTLFAEFPQRYPYNFDTLVMNVGDR